MLGSINGLGIDGVFESPAAVGPESREKETCWDIGIDGVFESPVGHGPKALKAERQMKKLFIISCIHLDNLFFICLSAFSAF